MTLHKETVAVWDRSSILISVKTTIPLISVIADRIRRMVTIDETLNLKPISQRFAMHALGYSSNFDLYCNKDLGLIGRTVPGTVAFQRAIMIANLLYDDLERLKIGGYSKLRIYSEFSNKLYQSIYKMSIVLKHLSVFNKTLGHLEAPSLQISIVGFFIANGIWILGTCSINVHIL